MKKKKIRTDLRKSRRTEIVEGFQILLLGSSQLIKSLVSSLTQFLTLTTTHKSPTTQTAMELTVEVETHVVEVDPLVDDDMEEEEEYEEVPKLRRKRVG